MPSQNVAQLPWRPRLRLRAAAPLGLICAGVALPLSAVTAGWSYLAGPLAAGALTSLVVARRGGLGVVCAVAIAYAVLIGMSMLLFLVLFLVAVGLGN